MTCHEMTTWLKLTDLKVFLPLPRVQRVSAMQDWTTLAATATFFTAAARELSRCGGDWNLPSSSQHLM